MSTMYRITVVFLCLLFCACSKSEFSDSQGNSANVKQHGERWLVINYWATWCKPCIEEIPELNLFAQQHSDKVRVFGVDFDLSQGQQLSDNIAKLSIQFPVLTTDPAVALGYPRPGVLPTTLIINPDGKLERTLIGPQTTASLLQAITP